MKKNLILLGAMMVSSFAFAQMGLNTATPNSTLDVMAKNTTGTTTNVDGLLVPRVDRQRAQSMASVPVSTLIYVTSAATGTQTGNAVNIDTPGYYYFDETNVWTKMKAPAGAAAADINIYKDDGTLQANRTVAQADKTLAFTSTATTGTNHFSVDGSTFSVDAVNNNVGIRTTTPHAPLQLSNGIGNRKIVMFETNNNDHQFYGLGINAGALRYQVDRPLSDHIFYSAIDATSSKELMRIKGDGNVGIGTTAPTNMLDVNATTDPLRLRGLQPSDNTTLGTLTTDGNGVVKARNMNTISAIRAHGNFTITLNNTWYGMNLISNGEVEDFDNLGEYSNGTFTPSQAGLYEVKIRAFFPEIDTSHYSAGVKAEVNGSLNATAPYAEIYIPAYQAGTGQHMSYHAGENGLLKLNAGDTVRLTVRTYRAPNGIQGNYAIEIYRVD